MEKKETKNVWYGQQEKILKRWGEIGSSYRYLHDRSYLIYHRKNMWFALPVIIISTITGTANFAQNTFPESVQPYVPSCIGLFNLVAGLVTTISQFLRVSELLEGHRAASIAYSKFARNISVELSLPIRERSCSGRDFINQCRTDLDRLIEQSPNIPMRVVKQFGDVFGDQDFIKPDILNINAVEIYKDNEEEERKQKEAEDKRKKYDKELADKIREQERQQREQILQQNQATMGDMFERVNSTQKLREDAFLTQLMTHQKKLEENQQVHKIQNTLDSLIQSLHKFDPTKNNETNIGKTEVGENEVGETEVGENEVGETEVGENEVGETEVGENEVGENNNENEVGENNNENEVGENENNQEVIEGVEENEEVVNILNSSDDD